MSEFRLRFKKFEIRKSTYLGGTIPENRQKDWDIVKWADDESHCWTIASLRWDSKDSMYEFESCGLRYLEYAESGLNEWIMAFAKFAQLTNGLEEECE